VHASGASRQAAISASAPDVWSLVTDVERCGERSPENYRVEGSVHHRTGAAPRFRGYSLTDPTMRIDQPSNRWTGAPLERVSPLFHVCGDRQRAEAGECLRRVGRAGLSGADADGEVVFAGRRFRRQGETGREPSLLPEGIDVHRASLAFARHGTAARRRVSPAGHSPLAPARRSRPSSIDTWRASFATGGL